MNVVVDRGGRGQIRCETKEKTDRSSTTVRQQSKIQRIEYGINIRDEQRSSVRERSDLFE